MDHFTAAGKKAALKECWDAIRAGLELEAPKPLIQYLGADYKFGEIDVPEVGTIRTCQSSMEDYFKAICDDFVALAKRHLAR